MRHQPPQKSAKWRYGGDFQDRPRNPLKIKGPSAIRNEQVVGSNPTSGFGFPRF
jgi:hypothetical protein